MASGASRRSQQQRLESLPLRLATRRSTIMAKSNTPTASQAARQPRRGQGAEQIALVKAA